MLRARGCQFGLDTEVSGTRGPGRCDKTQHTLLLGMQLRVVLYRSDAHDAPIWDDHLLDMVSYSIATSSPPLFQFRIVGSKSLPG